MVSTPPPITYSNLILTESPHLTSASSIGINISGFSIGVGPQIMFSFNLVKLVSLIPLIFNLSSSILKFSLRNFSNYIIIGELSLDGNIKKVQEALAICIEMRKQGIKNIKLVVIGQHLDKEAISAELDKCLAD